MGIEGDTDTSVHNRVYNSTDSGSHNAYNNFLNVFSISLMPVTLICMHLVGNRVCATQALELL